VSRKQNPLLKRDEVIFEVDHSEEGETSSRSEIRRKLADVLKTKLELTFVEKAETKTGTMIANGEANVYKTADQAHLIEREHIIQRNQLKAPEQPAEVKAPEQPAEVKAPEQPAEVKAPEQPAEVKAPEPDNLMEKPSENLKPKEAKSGELEPEEESRSEKESQKEKLTENKTKEAEKLEA
jgi:small subunit ribosomal protein S24e